MAVNKAEFSIKSFSVYGTSTVSSNQAKAQAYVELMKWVDWIFVTKLGLTRIDNNGNHDISTSMYFYQVYALNDDTDSSYFMVRSQTKSYDSGNMGINVSVYNSIPTDGTTSYTGNPSINRNVYSQSAQTGTFYTWNFYGMFMYLENDEIAMWNTGANVNFQNGDGFYWGVWKGHALFWANTAMFYYPNGDFRYLGKYGSYDIDRNDFYGITGIEQQSKLLVGGAQITPNNNRTSGSPEAYTFTEVLSYSSGQLVNGQMIQVESTSNPGFAEYYMVWNGNLYLFDIQDMSIWGNDS